MPVAVINCINYAVGAFNRIRIRDFGGRLHLSWASHQESFPALNRLWDFVSFVPFIYLQSVAERFSIVFGKIGGQFRSSFWIRAADKKNTPRFQSTNEEPGSRISDLCLPGCSPGNAAVSRQAFPQATRACPNKHPQRSVNSLYDHIFHGPIRRLDRTA